MSNKVIYALYNDDEVLMNGAKDLIGKGIRIKDAYSPFPVHGLEKVLGIPWTRLAICSFMYGVTGLMLAVVGIWYFMISDWPMDIGGKPSFSYLVNMPAFIPVTFEFTVLLAAHGMAITYLIRNWTLPGVKARNPHPRTTDDHFALEVHASQNQDHSEEEIRDMLKATNPVEVFDK